jgi:hypothetical protein
VVCADNRIAQEDFSCRCYAHAAGMTFEDISAKPAVQEAHAPA